MTHRRFASCCVLTLPLALCALTATHVTAQSAPVAVLANGTPHAGGWSLDRHRELVRTLRSQLGVREDYQPPRTAWDHPDLEGAWTSDAVHGVPRDRPAQFGTRMFLTDAEYQA